MIVEHAAAFLAFLDANPNLTYFDGDVPDETMPPYVVPWVSVDSTESVDVADTQGRINIRVTTHSLGVHGLSSRIVADKVRLAVHGKRPTVAGRNCSKIRHQFGLPPQRDEATGTQFVDVVDQYTFWSVPGTP